MLMKDISIIFRHGSALVQQNLPDLPLNCTDQGILLFLSKHDGVNQDTIAKFFLLNKTSITKALTRLEKMNLIFRKISATSKREKTVCLTDYALEVIHPINKAQDYFEESALVNLSAEEKILFKNLIKRVSQATCQLNQKLISEECD